MFAVERMQQHIVESIRAFVEREVMPVASQLEHQDQYPEKIVEGMKELGLFGANVPQDYGGLGLDTTTFAMIIEELARGWMSIVGPLGTHSVICDILHRFGTDEQRLRFLPGLASGERRGGLALSEADAGTDVQRLRTTATRCQGGYRINGAKMWITNARHGNTFVLAAKTDPHGRPAVSRYLGLRDRKRRRWFSRDARYRQAGLQGRGDLRTARSRTSSCPRKT